MDSLGLSYHIDLCLPIYRKFTLKLPPSCIYSNMYLTC